MDQKDLVLSNYATAFIDVLGQRDQLRGCGLLPKNKDEILQLAKNTIEIVRWLHSSFEDFYSSLTNRTTTINVPKQYQHEIENLRKIRLRYQRFSDGLVVYLSLSGDPQPESVNGLYGLVSTCGCLCLLGLIRGTPIRGGVDVAWGTELNDNELYGCAVAKAYELESEIAKYPRVVVGENVRNYLLDVTSQISGDDANNIYTRDLSKVCLDLLGQDSDGAVIVDYLGPSFRKHMSLEPTDYRKAYSYIETQIAQFQTVQNEKLRQRYETLKQYFERNRICWLDRE